MDSMIQDMQKTIRSLETLGNTELSTNEQIFDLLDQLYQHKIDLLNASLNSSSQNYQDAAKAMRTAALKAEACVKDHAKLRETLQAAADAITKLARLLDHVV
jgi:methyl-accepting chemotaxis protein